MTTRTRLVRWTFAEFRRWSASIRDKRQTARRLHALVRKPALALAHRRPILHLPTATA